VNVIEREFRPLRLLPSVSVSPDLPLPEPLELALACLPMPGDIHLEDVAGVLELF